MVVESPGTSADGSGNSNGAGQTNDFASDTSICPTDNVDPGGIAEQRCDLRRRRRTGHLRLQSLRREGLVLQRTNPCSQSYYGQTNTPDKEGDAFVSGNLSGHLTIGANNDVVIDGPITYADCTSWAGTAHESACAYNNASPAPTTPSA